MYSFPKGNDKESNKLKTENLKVKIFVHQARYVRLLAPGKHQWAQVFSTQYTQRKTVETWILLCFWKKGNSSKETLKAFLCEPMMKLFYAQQIRKNGLYC